jgi:DNA replication protein DnaC
MPLISENLPDITIPSVSPEALHKAQEAQRRRLAEELGLCSPDCEICAGVGYYRLETGLVQLCPNVDIWRIPASKRLGVSQVEYDTLSWNSIKRYNQMAKAVKAVQATLERGAGWIYLHGGFGVGKTYLLKIAVIQALKEHPLGAAYIRMAEIFDHLRDAFKDGARDSDTERLKWWSEIPFLAIDEFDRARLSDYASERRFVLMDRRYEMAIAGKGITLMASNKPPEEIDADGYLVSRIRDGRFEVIDIGKGDVRERLEWQQ